MTALNDKPVVSLHTCELGQLYQIFQWSPPIFLIPCKGVKCVHVRMCASLDNQQTGNPCTLYSEIFTTLSLLTTAAQ